MQYRDPVCGMIIDASTAGGEAYYRSTHHYFCSTACRDRFEANPSQYVSGTRSPGHSYNVRDIDELERHEPPHTESGGIVAPKFGSAGSGGAEYERLPERHDD
jgi:YHS domain-containing protein